MPQDPATLDVIKRYVQLEADVRPDSVGAPMCINLATADTATILRGIADHALALAEDCQSSVRNREFAEQEAAKFLGTFTTLKMFTKLYAATAPYGVDAANQGGYVALHDAAIAADDALRRAIEADGGRFEYPLRATHERAVASVGRAGVAVDAMLDDGNLGIYLSSIPDSELAREDVRAGRDDAVTAMGVLLSWKLRTPSGDTLKKRINPSVLEPGSKAPPDTTVLGAMLSLSMATAAPLPGPNCLLQAVVEVWAAGDLADKRADLAGMLVADTKRLSEMTVKPPRSKFLVGDAEKLAARYLEAFGDDPRIAKSVLSIASLLDSAPTKERMKFDAYRQARARDLAREVYAESGYRYPLEHMEGVFAIASLVGVYSSLAAVVADVNKGPLATMKNLTDVCANGFPAVATFLKASGVFAREEMATLVADTLGNAACVLMMVSAAIGMYQAYQQGDLEAGLKAAATCIAAGLLFVGVAFAGSAAAMSATVVGNLILIVLVLVELYEWHVKTATDQANRAEPSRVLVNQMVSYIDAFFFTAGWTDREMRPRDRWPGAYPAAIETLKSALAEVDFFGMPPLFPLDPSTGLDADAVLDYPAFAAAVDAVVPKEAAFLKRAASEPSLEKTRVLQAHRELCLDVLKALIPAGEDMHKLLFWGPFEDRRPEPGPGVTDYVKYMASAAWNMIESPAN